MRGFFFWNKFKLQEISFEKLPLTEKIELSINLKNVAIKGF